MRAGVVAGLLCAAAVGAGAGAARTDAAAAASTPAAAAATPVVPSLDPAATGRLWRELVSRAPSRAPQRAEQAPCRPLRAIFYAQTDWLRLATRLAAAASPCAQYYVSVPPLTSDKTQLRAGQAAAIRALGPSFHALAEIQYTAWSRWVAANGGSWFDAGVEARKRMAAAGFDVGAGDTWAVNEFSSAVRQGLGGARQNVRDLVRGLATGDGSQAPVRGVAFVIGVDQNVPDPSLYQTTIQNWLVDNAFWGDMGLYVSDWSQEVYGDIRDYGVAGVPIQTRRDYLNDYLQHPLVLAGVGPESIAAARSFLQAAYSPLANAAWQWGSGYGWTMVPFDQMAGFVAAQVYALRAFSATTGQPQDHWGFAWAPRNGSGLSAADFVSQTNAILDRLAQSIRDSSQPVDPNDPGSGACGPVGQNLYCAGDVAGGHFVETWKSFRGWTQPVLELATPPQTLAAGAPGSPLTVALQTAAGAPFAATADLGVTVSSSSPAGVFSVSPTGPWTPTLVLTIPAGGSATPPFYYEDTRAGVPTVAAVAPGATSAAQTETVQAGPPATATLAPPRSTVPAGGSATFTVQAVDAYGNPTDVTAAAWTLTPATVGALSATSGATTTFAAAQTGGRGTVAVTVGAATASAAVTVLPGRLHVAAIRYSAPKGGLVVTTLVLDARGKPIANATVLLTLLRNGQRYTLAHVTTGPTGRAVERLKKVRGGCYTTTIRNVGARGYVWDRQVPKNRFCR